MLTRHIIGGHGEIRTHTVQALNLFALPIGVRDRTVGSPSRTRTETAPGLSRFALPIGVRDHILSG